MLKQVEFENFRGFRQLALNGLRRVNLIVGKNNSGKTSLIEGIATLVSPTVPVQQYRQLRQLEQHVDSKFNASKLSKWVVYDGLKALRAEISGIWRNDQLRVVLGEVRGDSDSVSRQHPEGSKKARQEPVIPTCVVSAQHRSPQQLVESLGNAVRRQQGEELLESTLASVDPRIKKVRISPVGRTTEVFVDIGLSSLIPISQVGQGVYRLVEIFSEIIGADARIAFIDEIENGIHHSSLSDIWRGIAEAAKNFDVQIFATTHSYECIEAAHAAFLKQPKYELGIVQLFRESGRIQGRVLDEEHIAAAIDGDIDLRG